MDFKKKHFRTKQNINKTYNMRKTFIVIKHEMDNRTENTNRTHVL